MDYIKEHSKEILCISAMWQSSRTTDGPAARDKEAWERNSLVEALVQESKSRYELRATVQESRMMIRSMGVVLEIIAVTHGIDNGYYSHSEQIQLAVVCSSLSQHLPLHFLEGRKLLSF